MKIYSQWENVRVYRGIALVCLYTTSMAPSAYPWVYTTSMSIPHICESIHLYVSIHIHMSTLHPSGLACQVELPLSIHIEGVILTMLLPHPLGHLGTKWCISEWLALKYRKCQKYDINQTQCGYICRKPLSRLYALKKR